MPTMPTPVKVSSVESETGAKFATSKSPSPTNETIPKSFWCLLAISSQRVVRRATEDKSDFYREGTSVMCITRATIAFEK
jgi:hypothetical protein